MNGSMKGSDRPTQHFFGERALDSGGKNDLNIFCMKIYEGLAVDERKCVLKVMSFPKNFRAKSRFTL